MSLTDWLATPHRWRELLDLVDELPSACRLREAILNDPDEAAAIIADEEAAQQSEMAQALAGAFGASDLSDRLDDDEDQGGRPARLWRPRNAEWDLAAIQRSAIHGAITHLSSKTPAFKGWRPPPASAFLPAPRTLVDDLRDEADRATYAEGMAIFAPNAPT